MARRQLGEHQRRASLSVEPPWKSRHTSLQLSSKPDWSNLSVFAFSDKARARLSLKPQESVASISIRTITLNVLARAQVHKHLVGDLLELRRNRIGVERLESVEPRRTYEVDPHRRAGGGRRASPLLTLGAGSGLWLRLIRALILRRDWADQKVRGGRGRRTLNRLKTARPPADGSTRH